MFRPLFLICYFISGWIAATLRFRLRIEGGGRELSGPALVLGKHASYWDIPMVARGMRTCLRGVYPWYEMASFHGYPLLGRLIWFMRLNGGFPVMRPKDLIRLKRGGITDKAELRAVMKGVNDEAAATRRRVFEKGDAVCYFPEGTRDPDRVLPLRSFHEIEEALAFAAETGRPVVLLPVLPCYGTKPRSPLGRRKVIVKVLDPLETEERSAASILADAQSRFDAAWLSPADVDSAF
jgi:1-acyl-sn-glycerol-3-phosphate acyltransferase